MAGPVGRRRTRTNSGEQLIVSQAIPSKRAKKSRDEGDQDKENALVDKSLLVECLTNAGMIVKRGEEQNVL